MRLAGSLLFSLVVFTASHAPGQGKATVVSASSNSLIVGYTPSSYTPTRIVLNGSPHLYYAESEAAFSAGASALPLESFMVGIPPEGSVRVELLEAPFVREQSLSPAPVASMELVEGEQKRIVRKFETDVHETAGAESPVELEGIHWFRDQRVAVIRIRPVVQAATGELTTYSSFRIKVEFEKPMSPGNVSADPLFEPVYRSRIVNYSQALPWRRSSQTQSAHVTSSSQWFVPGAEYLKIKVARDGVVRIPYEAVGPLLTSSHDPRTFDLMYRGVSVPLWISGESDGVFGMGDTIEFWGTSLRDSLSIANEYSDTSVYWLNLSGTGGVRTVTTQMQAVTPDVIITNTIQVVRAEQDSFYYFGDFGLPANNQTEKVAGEGWYWRKLLAGQSTTVTVTSRNFFRTGNPDFVIRGRLHSPVAQQSTPNHRIEISLNGTLLGTIDFPGSSDTVFALPAASSLFLEGENRVLVRSVPTAATVNEVFLDWVEMEVKKELVADGDTLNIVPGQGAPGQIAQFQISGFTENDVSIYRVTASGGLEKKLEGSIAGGGGNYSVTFYDTLVSNRSYFVSTESGKKNPAQITKKVLQNLRSGSLGADYLVISGTKLMSEAMRLADYRGQQGGYRTRVVDVEDIYDEFNFGHFSPEPIREFLLAVDSLWVPPKPAYVVLFGDANWDYRDNLGTGKPNVVPSYGNPVSDSWFVESPATPFLPQKIIGRIPVGTLSGAKEFVDMLIAYEATPLSPWNKTFMFMASGFNSTETARFQLFSDRLIDSLITPGPIAGSASRLYKTVTNVVEFEQTEEVKRMLGDGAVWINFYGHAGTELWGNGISSAAHLRNREGKRHLVSDISCSTVRFAEPLIDSFGERLLGASEGGAVGYLGSSGFGFESPLRAIAQEIYTSFAKDTVREPGVLVLKAKSVLWQISSGSLLSRQALRQFTLLGDPAMQIRVARAPDPAVTPGTFSTVPEVPSEADDRVSVTTPVFNFGLATAESLTVRWSHSFEGGQPEVYESRMKVPQIADTVMFSVPAFKRGGTHSLTIQLDPANSVGEESEGNNSASMSFFVTSGNLQLLRPLSSSLVHPDSVRFTVQNPNVRLQPTHRLLLEVDTAEAFNSPSKIIVPNIPLGVLVTEWVPAPGALRDSTTYYWRGRVYDNADSTDWVSSVFRTSRGLNRPWAQEGAGMFRRNSLAGVAARDSMRLLERDIPLEVNSAGFDYGSQVSIVVDGVDVSLGFVNRGYNIAVVNQYSGSVESFAAFDIHQDPDTAGLAQYLEDIPEGRWVLAAISDEGALNKTERINRAFEAIGSSMIRSVGFRSSWAIVGRKGAAIGSVREEMQVSGFPIKLQDTLRVTGIEGRVVTETIGPAIRWKAIEWDVDTASGLSRISMDLIRSYDTGSIDTVANVIPGVTPIAAILPEEVKSIRLVATLYSDSAGLSPTLNRWSVDFDSPPELAIGYQTITLDQDSVLEGEGVTVSGSLYNIGEAPAESVSVAFFVLDNNAYVEFSRIVLPTVAAGSSVPFVSAGLNTSGHAGKRSILVFVDPEKIQRESLTNNNAVSLQLAVLADTVAPTFDVRFDGVPVLDGDYVTPSPEIRVIIRDNSPLPMTDPNNVVFMLDGRRITLGEAADSLFEPLSGAEKAQVIVRPKVDKGPHVLSLQVLDASGNPADTMNYELRFNVETATRLLNVYNFPNPFSSETAFTFHLTGATQPDEVRIRIYTIAGRLIYERTLVPGEVNVGFNRIVWDGRDQNGDPVANGVYFYKITALGGGERVEVVEKVARVR